MNGFVSDTAKIVDSEYPDDIKLFRNAVLSHSRCGQGVSIGDDTTIERCVLGDNVAINRRSYINDSEIGCFSYTGINTTMNFTRMGKFCSVARNVDIGGFDHDYHKVTTMPMFRFQQMLNGTIPQMKQEELCLIGNDVWIAAGAQILHKAKIGDGAIVGARAVVTHDVPPYAIAVGIPAKIIGTRFEQKFIDELLDIQWWNWPLAVILENMQKLIHTDVNKKTIEMMRDISKLQKPFK